MRWILGILLLRLVGCGASSKTDAQSVETSRQDSLIISAKPDPPSFPPEATPAFLLGKFNPKTDTLFTAMEATHSGGSARNQYIQKRTYEAFIRMYEAAKQEGIQLVIVSAARNFSYQKSIWERKWKGQTKVQGQNLAETIADPVERAKKILLYSSMPGSSRHHWGTDIDLNQFNNAWFESGEGKKVYDWLLANASQYGFCQTYTAKGTQRPHGYEEEKWHWSYMPLSGPYLKAYQAQIQVSSFEGFLGSEVAEAVGIIPNYVLGIHSGCQ